MAIARGNLVHVFESSVVGHTTSGTLTYGPTALASTLTGSVQRGNAVQLPTGEVMVTGNGGGGSPTVLFLDSALASVALLSTSYFYPGGAASTTHFYLLASATSIKKYGPTGSLVATITVSGLSIDQGQFGVRLDGTKAIAVNVSNSIYEIDLGTGVATLLFTEASHSQQPNPGGITVLQDDTFIVSWFDGVDVYINKYDTAGTLLWATTFTGTNKYVVQTGRGLSAASFYVGITEVTNSPTSGDGIVTVSEVNASTGARTALFTGAWPSPADGFGRYDNSALFVWSVSSVSVGDRVVSVDNSVPCCDTGGSGGSAAGPILPAVSTDWTPRCTGGGTVPTAADLTTSEDWSA